LRTGPDLTPGVFATMIETTKAGSVAGLSLAIALTITAAPSGQARPPAPAAPAAAATPQKQDFEPLVVASWTGDFDGMVKRRRIRILTPYSKTSYFVDKGVPRGVIADVALKLEEHVNAKLRTTNATRVHVIVVPTSRDVLYESLTRGRGDVVAASVTVTPERAKLVDFTIPVMSTVREIVVTGPGGPAIAKVDDLSGQTVYVREKSIQFESLEKLNDALEKQGKPPVVIKTVPTALEDEDILEMANAGLLKVVVVNDYHARFWKQILPDIRLHDAVAVREEGALAWAVRKGSPQLIAELNPFIKANGTGTLFGNMLIKKYFQNAKFVKGATSPEEIRKFNQLITMFRKYGTQYEVDYLLMMAQGFQESRLDQSVKSRVGAIGVMQVMPATGKEMKVGDITKVDSNINAGVKYVRFMIDQYFKDEPMDDLNKGLFAFASYNAGPARIRQLRKLAAARGLDPNVWFNNVERVVAEKIGRETVTYVSNIYKYYIAYTLTMEELRERERLKAATGGQL
jgi:membrane-bound lytic murein transglycosylase MltF